MRQGGSLGKKKKKGGVIFPEGRGMDAGQSIDILHGECCANEGRTEVWTAFICLFTPAPVIILRDPCFHLNNSSKTSKFLGLCNCHNFHKITSTPFPPHSLHFVITWKYSCLILWPPTLHACSVPRETPRSLTFPFISYTSPTWQAPSPGMMLLSTFLTPQLAWS